MAVDHVGMLFDPLSAFFAAGDPMRQLLRYPGRLSFPIFAFFVAEGCRKTRNYPAYLQRLGLFALLTQLPLLLLPSLEKGGSVLVTFLGAALGIYLWRVGQARGWREGSWLAMGCCILAADFLGGDYGWMGALLVCAVYLAGEDRRRQLLVLGGRPGLLLSALPAVAPRVLPCAGSAGRDWRRGFFCWIDGGASLRDPLQPAVLSSHCRVRAAFPPAAGPV